MPHANLLRNRLLPHWAQSKKLPRHALQSKLRRIKAHSQHLFISSTAPSALPQLALSHLYPPPTTLSHEVPCLPRSCRRCRQRPYHLPEDLRQWIRQGSRRWCPCRSLQQRKSQRSSRWTPRSNVTFISSPSRAPARVPSVATMAPTLAKSSMSQLVPKLVPGEPFSYGAWCSAL